VNIQSEPVMIVKMPDLSPRRLWGGVELGLYLVFRMSDVVSRPGGTGELGLFGFVLSSVRCSLFVVYCHKTLFLLYLCLYCLF